MDILRLQSFLVRLNKYLRANMLVQYAWGNHTLYYIQGLTWKLYILHENEKKNEYLSIYTQGISTMHALDIYF